MTAMQQLISKLDPIHSYLKDEANQLLEIEKKQIFDAMLHALDEDGHTGEWKIKFIEGYINNLYNK